VTAIRDSPDASLMPRVRDQGYARDLPGVLAGPPEKIAHYLRKFKDLGVQHLQVKWKARSIDEQVDQMRAFATDVVPLVEA